MAIDNFAAMFRDRARRYADRACLRYKSDGRWVDLTWHEVDTWVRQIAAGLIALGFKKGDRLALLSEIGARSLIRVPFSPDAIDGQLPEISISSRTISMLSLGQSVTHIPQA